MTVEGDRRAGHPGRRVADAERELIRAEVRGELRAQRRRWLIVWLLTLAFSSYAWYLADDANDGTGKVARAAQAQAQEATLVATKACQRSKRFLPYFVESLDRSSSIPPSELNAFRTLVPRRC